MGSWACEFWGDDTYNRGVEGFIGLLRLITMLLIIRFKDFCNMELILENESR